MKCTQCDTELNKVNPRRLNSKTYYQWGIETTERNHGDRGMLDYYLCKNCGHLVSVVSKRLIESEENARKVIWEKDTRIQFES